ncbi:hypothetical protein L7F22_052145 [Adiantum nelumboides]|nr:hypothetical protein [Adiantum nelumboides]
MVLRTSYQLLEEGKQATQRKLFYGFSAFLWTLFAMNLLVAISAMVSYFRESVQHGALLPSKHLALCYLVDVVAVFKCSRNSLGMLASSKGSMIGRLLIQESNGGARLDYTKMGSSGQVISGHLKCVQNWTFQCNFQRLQEDRFFHSVPCIIMIARGHRDLASRHDL